MGGEGRCAWCARPTAHPLQHYHDRAKELLGRCLVIDPAKEAPLISRREGERGQRKLRELFDLYLRSEDAWVTRTGHSLTTFCSATTLNALLAQAGRTDDTQALRRQTAETVQRLSGKPKPGKRGS